MRPREKQMFVIPACFISRFHLSFFIICYWKSWNEQKPTVITFNTYINLLLFYILLRRYISACQTNRRYFYKMNRLLYTDSYWCFKCTLSIKIYRTMVITFLFKTYQNKPDLHVLNRSRRGCYLTGAKFWQRNCKAM